MSQMLYMKDSYLKEWDAKIVSISKKKYIVLDKTAFFPMGGGVEYDTGTLKKEDGRNFSVIYTGKFSGEISHEVDKPEVQKGDEVQCLLNWNRRYTLMRYHTATHVLSGIFFKEYGLKITGNQLTTEKGCIDVNMEKMDVDIIQNAIESSNAIIQKDLPVEISYISREEAEQDPELFKLAMGFPHNIQTIRIVDIKGFDRQADGGCHVNHLKEIGRIDFTNAVNKGKENKRVYFELKKV